MNGGYGINYIATFYCNDPYVRFGPEEDRCQSSGKWVDQDETRTCRQGSAPSDGSKGVYPRRPDAPPTASILLAPRGLNLGSAPGN